MWTACCASSARAAWNCAKSGPLALRPDTFAAVRALGCESRNGAFHLDDELWAKVIYEFACAYRRSALERGHLMRSLTPLYLARVASFVLETSDLLPDQVDAKIEDLCCSYESLKPYLIANWTGSPREGAATGRRPSRETVKELKP